MMHKSLPAAIALKPGEIIIAIDKPENKVMMAEILGVAHMKGYNDIRFIAVEKTPDWNFQLAKLLWTCYKLARYDKIYSFDVDSIPTKNIFYGYNRIGLDGIAVYSFTKRLRLDNLSDLIRYIFYRYRVATSSYVFSGNYWIDRKAFFEIVNEQEYKAISNGVDTYLTEKITEFGGKYKVVTDKKIGVKCMTLQNEDYPWRQFQDGLWLGANVEKWASLREWQRKKRDFTKLRSKPQLLLNAPSIIIKGLLALLSYKILDDPIGYVYVKAFIYQHPHLLKGYKWARANENSEIVKAAKAMNLNEWGFQGAKIVRQIPGLTIAGTGSS